MQIMFLCFQLSFLTTAALYFVPHWQEITYYEYLSPSIAVFLLLCVIFTILLYCFEENYQELLFKLIFDKRYSSSSLGLKICVSNLIIS